MAVVIFGYKVEITIVILILVIYLIMLVHTLCGCCNHTLMEGYEMLSSNTATASSTIPQPIPAGNIVSNKKVTEPFVGANTNYGQSSPYDLAFDNQINTASWSAPNLTVTPGKPLSSGVKQILNRKPQPVPLPKGEMDMFATTPFKPECCPNTYSNSSGCACMTTEQYNWLQVRGGNNVPYSQY